MIPIVVIYKLIFAEGSLKERWISLTTPILKPHQLRPGRRIQRTEVVAVVAVVTAAAVAVMAAGSSHVRCYWISSVFFCHPHPFLLFPFIYFSIFTSPILFPGVPSFVFASRALISPGYNHQFFFSFFLHRLRRQRHHS